MDVLHSVTLCGSQATTTAAEIRDLWMYWSATTVAAFRQG
jgi:hypothetical protein